MSMLELPSDDLQVPALLHARAALSAGRYDEAARAYGDALAAADARADAAPRRRAVWVEHVGQLASRGRLAEAARSARAYLNRAEEAGEVGASLALHVLLSEVLLAQGDQGGSLGALRAVEGMQSHPALLPDDALASRPAVLRLQALHAAGRGERSAAELLDAAGAEYAERGDADGIRVIAADRERLALDAGDPAVVGDILDRAAPEGAGIPELLARARALRRDSRYQAAAQLLTGSLGRDIDPALRFSVLLELVQLHQLLGDRETAERLLPLLRESAPLAGNPDEAAATADRLSGLDSAAPRADFDSRLHHARVLVEKGRADEAGQALRSLRPRADSPRREAHWSLAAGEQALAAAKRAAGDAAAACAKQALLHLERARELARRHSLPEIHVQALRLTGRVHDSLFQDVAAASEFWGRAHQSDELIAHRQETDAARIRYLESRPSLHDEQVEAAAARVSPADGRTPALAVAALEAARSASVLSLILPQGASARSLPRLNDVEGAWAWCAGLAAELPGDLAVWMLHATPGHVHHALVAKGFLHCVQVAADRQGLVKEIDGLNACWRYGPLLHQVVQSDPGRITGHLRGIAAHLALPQGLAGLPDRITRLAVVAGGELGDVPFSALPLPGPGGEEQPLVRRFAVSRQPCLSTYLPLRARGRASRGGRALVVRPPDAYLRDVNPERRCTLLRGEAASAEGLAALLQTRAFRVVQVDCHGRHDERSGRDSWLQLAPGADDDGRLIAGRLQEQCLDGCGTLVLGACESGMTQRVGREERVGFIRAGLAAGAAAVLAAQWVAEDRTAGFILSRFRSHLRYLPRDVALRRAQLAFLDAGDGMPRPLPEPSHPAWWACWNLHGDPGLQTRAPGPVRALRRAAAALWPAP